MLLAPADCRMGIADRRAGLIADPRAHSFTERSGESDVLAVSITAAASGPIGDRFAQHAVVEIASNRRSKPCEVLGWTSSLQLRSAANGNVTTAF